MSFQLQIELVSRMWYTPNNFAQAIFLGISATENDTGCGPFYYHVLILNVVWIKGIIGHVIQKCIRKYVNLSSLGQLALAPEVLSNFSLVW